MLTINPSLRLKLPPHLEQKCKIQIITKSDIVARDIDLLRRVPSMVSLTVTTGNDDVSKLIEPHAPPALKRIKTVEFLLQKNIRTSVRIDPVIPFVNDRAESLIHTLASLGVKHITCSTYKVKMDNWRRFSLALPEVTQKLKPLYFEKGEKVGGYLYLPKAVAVFSLEHPPTANTSRLCNGPIQFSLNQHSIDGSMAYGCSFSTMLPQVTLNLTQALMLLSLKFKN